MLIFIPDTNDLEKFNFYKDNVYPELLSKIVFVQGTSLRESIRLLGAKYTSMIIGPCTGLMHCASGIYSVQKDIPRPPIIVYKGFFDRMDESDDLHWWWGGNDVVECIMKLKESENLICLSDIERAVLYHELDYTTKIESHQLLEKISKKFQSDILAT